MTAIATALADLHAKTVDRNPPIPLPSPAFALPALVAGERAQLRFLEFFAARIRNPNTRRAYGRAVGAFLAWCEGYGVLSIAAVQPLYVAGHIGELTRERSAPTAKQRLPAIRVLFDCVVKL